MTIPRVGPIVALGFTSTIDIPARFRNSRAVGRAYYQIKGSGEIACHRYWAIRGKSSSNLSMYLLH